MRNRSNTVLEWGKIFPLPGHGCVPIVARHNPRHGECSAHGHDFMELVLIAGGSGIHESTAGNRRLQRGDVIVLRPGSWHGYHKCNELDIYNLAFGSCILHRELAWALEDPALNHLLVTGPLTPKNRGVLHLRLQDDGIPPCERHLEELTDLGMQETPNTDRARRVGLLLLILGDILAGAHIKVGPDPATTGLHPSVARGMFLMENDLARDWSLVDVATMIGMERSYLIRLFKGGTGMPPMAYLARRRAERAAFLLSHTGAPISEIAQQVGWNDPVYFARRFKAHFSMTATEYRTRFRNPE